jgi:hypothetical protein
MSINGIRINRILQDKINLLTDDELEALGNDYIGQLGVVLWDGNFHIAKIKSFQLNVHISTNYGYEIGDKDIKFEFEDGRILSLQDFAIVGDTLEVMKKGAINEKLMVADIQTDALLNKIEFDNGEKMDYGNMDTLEGRVVPMVMDIGWLMNKQLITFGIDWKRYDLIDFGNKLNYVSGVVKKYGFEEIEFSFKNSQGNIETNIFNSNEFEKYFKPTPEVYRIDEGDVFISNVEEKKVTIKKVYLDPNTKNRQTLIFRPKIVDFVLYDKVSGERTDNSEMLSNFVKYLILRDYIFDRSNTSPQSQPIVEPKELNMEGDFIGEFVNNNATNLLELEQNNRPLFDLVEMTLSLLNKKFGKGDDIAEKVDVVIDNADEIITSVQGKDVNLIGLKEIEVIVNEGSPNIKGNKYTSWTEFTDALKPLLEIGVGGYNKVKFKATFDDGKHIIERIDVGENSYNPFDMKVGEYIERPFGLFDNLDDDIDKYVWDDEIIITEEGEQEPTKEDVENQIKALNISLMFEDDQERIDEINQKINALNITLTII